MAKSVQIDNETVRSNILGIQAWMKKNDLETFYISSYDQFLNEYVPMEDSHRFYVTNFSGSVAEVLIPSTGRIKLYVDGRYHEQADMQVDSTLVEVVKVTVRGLTGSLLTDLEALGAKNIGIEADRTSLGLKLELEKITNVVSFKNQELESVATFGKLGAFKEISIIPKHCRGRSTVEKLDSIFKDKKSAYFVTAIDSLAWITNCRGYHLPNLSSFLGRALVVCDKVFVFIDESIPVSQEAKDEKGIHFYPCNVSSIGDHLKNIQKDYKLETVYYDPNLINASDFEMIDALFGSALKIKKGGLVEYHSIKDVHEMKAIEDSFNRADTAIFNTIKWAKENVRAGKEISELDLYHQTSIEYKKQGACEQSFNTISGVGPNGSIIHYGDPKANIKIKADDMCLLDSGGYFESGFATDTTRTFMASDIEGRAEYKKMYTLVLKGTLQVQNALFPVGTMGSYLDALARRAIYNSGQNYSHGTGHGVGIHVHESGAGITNAKVLLFGPDLVDKETYLKVGCFPREVFMKYPPIYYGDYLALDTVLNSQHLKSVEYSKMAHDEMLFIITHQSYELWFKQILHELDSVYSIFKSNRVLPGQLSTVNHRLHRITQIQEILINQLKVMETMTSLDFMEFRDYLIPASGFQSIQFRKIETLLGLKQKFRLPVDNQFFKTRLNANDQKLFIQMESEESLLDLLDQWLSRMPFASQKKYNFWQDYQKAINLMLAEDKKLIEKNETLGVVQKEFELQNLYSSQKTFELLFNEQEYLKHFESGSVRLSQRGKLSAIFIQLFREEPILQAPFKTLELLVDIDEMFTLWRYKHSIMVHRILGKKIGTGGSSGHEYLKQTADNNRIFIDLFDLATFLLPKSRIPKLPQDVKKDLGLSYEEN